MASLPAFPPPKPGQNSATRIAAKITAVYALLAAFWIYFSDRLLLLFVQDIHQLDRMQTAKGWFFVLITTLLFFYLSRQSLVREQANQVALLQQKTLLKQVIDTIPVGIRLVDLKGEVTFVNPASTSIRGAKRIMSIEEEDRSLSRALYHGEMSLDDELLIEIPDGSQKTILESTVPLLNRNGELTGAIVINQDITKRKALETDWRLSQFCMEQASIGIFRIDEEGKILDANSYACNSLGYTHNELCTLSVFDIDPCFSQDYWLAHRAELRTRGAGTIETRHRRKDGSTFPVEVSINYLEYEGKPFSFSFTKDITERKQTEAALRDAKDFAENLIQTANVLFIQLDGEGRVVRVNETTSTVTGYSKAELIGQNWFNKLVPRERFPEVWNEFEQITRYGEMREFFENPVLTKEGDERYILWKNRQLQDGETKAGSISFGMDITARKEAEEALKYHQQLLQQVGRVAKIGGWEFNPGTGEGTWTEEVARIHDLDPGEPTNVERGISFYSDESRLKLEQAIKKAIEIGESYNLELEMETAKGAHKWVQTIGRPVIDKGKVVNVRGSFQDITDRKQSEFELLHHKKHLEELVAERTAELKAANQDLKAFSYSVSHDLRAPLRAVSGFAHILTNRYKSALDEQGQHYLGNIETAAERMSKLIDDLLTYSRLGQRGVRLQPVPLNKILSVLTEERAQLLSDPGVTLTVAPALPIVLGDPTLLRQALANLLDNALTYRRPGVSSSVSVDWEELEDDVVISIRDNGIGIAAEYQEKIFDVFQRLHSDDDFPGTGIGLSIVKKVADLLGGSVGVESIQDEGSSFNLRLNRAPQASQQGHYPERKNHE